MSDPKVKSDYTAARLTRQERAALEALAELEGRDISGTLRRLIQQEARSRGVWPSPEAEPERARP